MIDYLALRNFRAFRNERFKFSKINVFVGKNNSGKSSVLSALNLIAQSTENAARDGNIVLNGQFDELGTYLDVVNGHNPRTRMGIVVGAAGVEVDIDLKYRTQRREIEINKYSITRESEHTPIFCYSLKRDSFDIQYSGQSVDNLLPSHPKRKPIFNGLLARDLNLRNWRFSNGQSDPGRSKVSEEKYTLVRDIDFALDRTRSLLQAKFLRYDFLSPFRDAPRRTFLFAGNTASRVGKHGSNAIDMLVADTFKRGKASAGIVDEVSKWLKRSGIAQGIKVNPLTSRHYEIVITGNDGADHNICDVGFGISQVLPVLIGAMNLWSQEPAPRSVPIFVVQEPEIHLHPDAQAELATFFVNVVSKRSGQIFIETHSPDFIIRLQKHIADGSIKKSDLRVFFVEGAKQTPDKKYIAPVVTSMEFDDQGFFVGDWPGGFFPQREKESYDFARAASQKMKEGSSNLNDLFE